MPAEQDVARAQEWDWRTGEQVDETEIGSGEAAAGRDGTDDTAAFTALFRRYWRPLVVSLHQRGATWSDAEDWAGEAFAAAWAGRHRGGPHGSWWQWLAGIARRARIDAWRHATSRGAYAPSFSLEAQRVPTDETHDGERRYVALQGMLTDHAAGDAPRRAEVALLVRAALAALPSARQRQALTLRYLDFYSGPDAARAMRLRWDAFRQMERRGLRTLRRQLEAQGLTTYHEAAA